MALTECIDAWTEQLWALMKRFWNQYARMRRQTGYLGDMTFVNPEPEFIRFIAAVSLDEADLDTYNNLCQSEGGSVFENLQSLQDGLLFNNAWANFVIIRAFLRGLQYVVAVLIFDESELVPLPLEWSQHKDHYVVLQLKGLHYSTVRLITDDQELPLLLDHKTVTMAIE
jgi:hypothetical protein